MILSISCNDHSTKKSNTEFEDYEFKLDGFEWDKQAYKFSSFIRDSVVQSKGIQQAAGDFSYIGDIENMHKMWDSRANSRNALTQEQKDSFSQFKETDAIEYILNKAKEHQVVIINEAHHMPQHRVFTTMLLDGLKEQGFNHLGLETYFSSLKTDEALQENGYPTLKTGFYTKEPQFGNLVREAHQKGFKIFGYESQGHENGKEREINQAKNIQEYLDKNPNEKLLIHCGFDHGYEGELSSKWEKAMAGRLTEFTNIDPLTINQVLYSEKSKREYENPYYQLTDLEKPTVFIKPDDKVFGEYKNGGWFDIAVFHPRSETYTRPKWMVYGDRREVDYSFNEADIKCPCLVIAYKKGEMIGSAVPYDIQETKYKKVKLVLDKSDYEIVIWNEKGKSLKSQIRNKN